MAPQAFHVANDVSDHCRTLGTVPSSYVANIAAPPPVAPQKGSKLQIVFLKGLFVIIFCGRVKVQNLCCIDLELKIKKIFFKIYITIWSSIVRNNNVKNINIKSV